MAPAPPTLVSKLVAEFIGTFFLVLTVGCNVNGGGAGNIVAGVLSIASCLMIVVYALGDVSGANVNPAVSLALFLSKKLDIKDMGFYMVVQLVAGMFAAWISTLIVERAENFPEFGPGTSATVEGGYGWHQAGVAELLYTFMLCFTVLNCAASRAHAGKDQFYGLAIGFVVVAGGYAAGHISGGMFNPAIALGLGVTNNGGFGTFSLYYIVFELLGGALAAVCFRIVRPHEFRELDRHDKDAAHPLSARLVAEFLGAFMLVLTVGLNVVNSIIDNKKLAAALSAVETATVEGKMPALQNVVTDATVAAGASAAALSIAAALMCMIFSLGSVSGAHFNPAVTVAVMISGRDKIANKVAGMYIAAQIVGGVCGGFVYAGLENGATFGLDIFTEGEGKWGPIVGAEICFTFLLAYTVLNVATVNKPLTQNFGLAIGFCIVAGGYAVGHISGACFNPAVSVGIALSHTMNGGDFWRCLPYAACQLVGAALAACAFFVTHAVEYEDDEAGSDEEMLARD